MNNNRDYQKQPLEILSFGGGVQSTAMIVMIKEGILEKPDIVIHSDTGSEMPFTEPIIGWAKDVCEEMEIPFVIVKSERGSLHEDYMKRGTIPMIGIRSCTFNFKIIPLRRHIRSIVGNGNGKILGRCWLGITTDESRRKIESDVKWLENSFPLLDQIPTSRQECFDYLKKYNLDVKKSGCFCCPYQGVKGFKKLRRQYPDLFQICLDMEEEFQKRRDSPNTSLAPTIRTLKSLDMDSIFTYFGMEKIPENESNCDSSGGCFL